MNEMTEAERLYQLAKSTDSMAEAAQRNLPASRENYRLSALLGHVMAQYSYANMLDFGEGGPRDDVEARRWYEASAAGGISDAQLHFGRMLELGRGGYTSKVEAARWYAMAVEQGDELAATNLGALHRRGEIEGASAEKAFELFTFAGEKLDGLAHCYLGEMYLQGEGVVEHGGKALYHYSIAVMLLPPGVNRDTALGRKDAMLAQHPGYRAEFEERAMNFIRTRSGTTR